MLYSSGLDIDVLTPASIHARSVEIPRYAHLYHVIYSILSCDVDIVVYVFVSV